MGSCALSECVYRLKDKFGKPYNKHVDQFNYLNMLLLMLIIVY